MAFMSTEDLSCRDLWTIYRGASFYTLECCDCPLFDLTLYTLSVNRIRVNMVLAGLENEHSGTSEAGCRAVHRWQEVLGGESLISLYKAAGESFLLGECSFCAHLFKTCIDKN